jgi:hypothetical protein
MPEVRGPQTASRASDERDSPPWSAALCRGPATGSTRGSSPSGATPDAPRTRLHSGPDRPQGPRAGAGSDTPTLPCRRRHRRIHWGALRSVSRHPREKRAWAGASTITPGTWPEGGLVARSRAERTRGSHFLTRSVLVRVKSSSGRVFHASGPCRSQNFDRPLPESGKPHSW